MCQTFYKYQFWYDFISLSRLDNNLYQSSQINELKDSVDPENKRLLFQLCAKPKFMINPINVLSPIKNFDEQSCRDMDDKNSGIMYLVEDGKCVQSFYQGEMENIKAL